MEGASGRSREASTNLAGSDDDVVDGDEDELDEEPDEAHDDEPDRRAGSHLGELCITHKPRSRRISVRSET
jgi:hypothetical protein